jgi:hypothetical protein
MKIYYYLISITFILSIISCNKELEVVYKPSFEEDFQFFKKLPLNDTVLLVLQEDLVHTIIPSNELGRKLNYFPYNIVFVHHALSKDNSLSEQYYMTLEEAKNVNDISVDILKRTIDHFKSEGKYVIVFGDLIGSYIGLRSLKRDGNRADIYALINGRIDLEEEILEVAEELKFVEINDSELGFGGYVINRENWADFRLITALAKPRYSVELANFNLSNLLFTYRVQNEDFGILTNDEVTFLENSGAFVFGFIGFGPWDGYEFYSILDFVRSH